MGVFNKLFNLFRSTKENVPGTPEEETKTDLVHNNSHEAAIEPKVLSEDHRECLFPHLYYVNRDDTKHLNIFAIAPKIKKNGIIEWKDTGRGRFFFPKEILLDGVLYQYSKDTHPKEIKIKTFDDEIVILSYLTKDFYDANFREICEEQPSFVSTEEMQHFFLTNF